MIRRLSIGVPLAILAFVFTSVVGQDAPTASGDKVSETKVPENRSGTTGSTAAVSTEAKSAADATPSAPPSNDSLAKVLSESKKAIAEREVALAARDGQLAEREALVQRQMDRYEGVIQKLRTEIDTLKKELSDRQDAFRSVYSKMEPKKAARILDEMDVPLATRILTALKQTQAAEILSQMSPGKAREVTASVLSQKR